MRMNELHSIEVVLTYMDGEAVMLVKSPPTGDYDSGAEAKNPRAGTEPREVSHPA